MATPGDGRSLQGRLAALNEATEAILSYLDWDLLLETIAHEGRRALGYGRAALYFPEGAGLRLVAHALSPSPAAFGVASAAELRLAEHEGLAAQALEARVPLRGHTSPPRGAAGNQPPVAVPLMAHGEALAVLALDQPQLAEDNWASERELARAFGSVAGLALENSQLFVDTRRREGQLLALGQIARTIYSRRDVEQVLETIYEETRRLIPLDTFAIALVTPQGAEARASHSLRLPVIYYDGLRQAPGMAPIDREAGEALASRRPTLVLREAHEVEREPRGEPVFGGRARPAASLVYAPMLTGEGVLGLVAVGSFHYRAYTRRHAALLQSVADQAAIAIVNAQLYEQVAERAERLAAVNEVARAVNSTLDLRSVLATVAHSLHRVVPAERTAVAIYDREQCTFQLAAVYCPDLVTLVPQGAVFPLPHTSSHEMVETALPVIDDDISTYATPVEEMLAREGFRSRLIVPVVVDDRVVAGLAASSREPARYTTAHVNAAQDLAAHVAVAWKNSHLYEDLERAYNQLKTAQDHLVRVEKLRALGQMSDAVAHDFNNVLANIMGQVETLIAHPEAADLPAALAEIRQSVVAAAGAVHRVQEFSRTAGEGHFETIELHRLAAEVVEATRQRWLEHARAAGMAVELVDHVQEVPPVRGDAAQLREVLTNLLFNAFEALESGGTVTVSTAFREGRVALSVQDTGPGLPEEVKRQVFEPFFTTKPAYGGVAHPGWGGLGMSVAYSIIARHGGQITVESEPGSGTRFTVWLPTARPPTATSRAVHSVTPGRVLIVDDDAMLCQILRRMLELDGHQVASYTSGPAAIQAFQPGAFDLVITDLGMPEMSGWELADRLHSLDEALPIVLLTGWGIDPTPVELRRHHIAQVLGKPYTLDDIRAVLARHIVKR